MLHHRKKPSRRAAAVAASAVSAAAGRLPNPQRDGMKRDKKQGLDVQKKIGMLVVKIHTPNRAGF